MASATAVTDHDEIRNWAELRGGHPACVKGTAALLRVDFDPPDAKLQPISWDQWFDTFESRRLAAMIQQQGNSRFIKLVSRGSANARRRGAGGASTRGRKTASGRGSSSRSASGASRTAKPSSSSRSTSKRTGAARKTASKRGTSTGRTAAKSATPSSTRASTAGTRTSGKRGTTSTRGNKAGSSRARGVAKKR